jgi:hypothetical protein
MSWIDEAKKKVARKNQKQEAESKRIQKSHLLAEKNPQKTFDSITGRTQTEIERVLSKARDQGLVVVGPTKTSVMGHVLSELIVRVEKGMDPLETANTYYSYALRWDITEPSSGKTMDFYLTVEEVINSGIWYLLGMEPLLYYVPSITAKEVESQIKEWLVKIFS